MNGHVPAGVYNVEVNIHDAVWELNVVSSVRIVVEDIEEEAVLSSGSMRFHGNYNLLGASCSFVAALPEIYLWFLGRKFQNSFVKPAYHS